MKHISILPFCLVIFISLLFPSQHCLAQAQFKAGDKVEAQDFTGKWFNAEIMAVTTIGYKVHYEGYSATWDEEIPTSRVRAKTGQAKNEAPGAKPTVSGGLPLLSGTHWAITSDKGSLPTLEFCVRGSWTLGHYRGGDEYGNYKISGTRLILYDGDGKLWGNFSMKWDGSVLTLSDATRILKLVYKGKLNDC